MVGQYYLIICEINFLDHRCGWLSSDGRGFIDFLTEEIARNTLSEHLLGGGLRRRVYHSKNLARHAFTLKWITHNLAYWP